MDGKTGKVLLAAILAVAVWSAFQIHRVADVVPNFSEQGSVGIRSTFRSSFIDANGYSHEIITTRGEIDPTETIQDCVTRHARGFLALQERFQ